MSTCTALPCDQRRSSSSACGATRASPLQQATVLHRLPAMPVRDVRRRCPADVQGRDAKCETHHISTVAHVTPPLTSSLRSNYALAVRVSPGVVIIVVKCVCVFFEALNQLTPTTNCSRAPPGWGDLTDDVDCHV